MLAALGACTTAQAPRTPAPEAGAATQPPAAPGAAAGAATRSLPSTPAFDAGVELPAGPGRDVLVGECLNCHELSALALFQDFYGRDSWRSLVISMRANGAEIDDGEVEVLSDYLARHFGTGLP